MTGEQTGACPLAGPRPGSRRLHVPNTHSRMEAMPFTHPSLSLLISSVLAASAALATQTREKSASGSVVPGRANEAFANLPLYFEPNQGQTEGQVKFLSRGAAHTLFLTHSKAVLLVTRIERGPVESWNSEPQTSGTVLGMSFIGASRNPQVLGQEELPGRVNYLVGSNPRTWRRTAPDPGWLQRSGEARGGCPGRSPSAHGSGRDSPTQADCLSRSKRHAPGDPRQLCPQRSAPRRLQSGRP